MLRTANARAIAVPYSSRPVVQKPSTGFGHFAIGAFLLLAVTARHRVVCYAAKKKNFKFVDPPGIDGNDYTEKNRVKEKATYFKNHPYTSKKIQETWPNMGYRISGAPGFPGSPHGWIERVRWCHRFRKRIRIRSKMEGTCARPRMAVYQSREKIYLNVIDDTIGLGQTLMCVSTQQADVLQAIREETGCEKGHENDDKEKAAEILGKMAARKCLEKEITQIAFDRGGHIYEGRIKALAEAARSEGLQF